MEETVKERIKAFITHEGISIREFERRCGMSNGYMAVLRHAPGADKLSAIFAAFPQLSRTWLLTGEGDMLTGSGEGGAVEPATGGTPFYGEMPVSAGRAGFPDGPEQPTGAISIPGVSAIAYFPVLGCSMLPLIRPGDIVGVALANGVPIESLSRMLGHRDIHTTQIYAKVLAQTVVDDGAELAGKIR